LSILIQLYLILHTSTIIRLYIISYNKITPTIKDSTILKKLIFRIKYVFILNFKLILELVYFEILN